MTDYNVFYELKKSVLVHYKKRHPYFTGDWKTFSSQDILNLIDAIQLETKNTVSEKWIYTHLKPETNAKLPRKDMLDILSQFAGTSSWDEFKYQFESVEKENLVTNASQIKSYKNIFFVSVAVIIIAFLLWKMSLFGKPTITIQLEEKFSKDTISKSTTKAFVIEDEVASEVPIQNSKIEVKNDAKVVLKSVFHKEATIDLNKTPTITKVTLQPNDYANILQGFIQSDTKDWQNRKKQLEMILHDNLEVIVMLQQNLGSEYLNKEEFSQKLIVPTASLKKLKMVEIKNDTTDKITFIRFIQE